MSIDFAALEQELRLVNPDCRLCSAWEGVRHVCVRARGSFPADILFVGEAPGPEEDRAGKAFVGKAGRLVDETLRQMLEGEKLTYRLTNAARCFPGRDGGGNFKKPTAKTLKACRPYLVEEIRLVKPKVIVALGGTATKAIAGDGRITKLRGLQLTWVDPETQEQTPVIAAYHPAFILRDMTRVPEWAADLKRALMIAVGGAADGGLGQYRLLETFEEVKTFLQEVVAAKLRGEIRSVSLDTETDSGPRGGDPMLRCWGGGQILTVQISVRPGEAVMIALHHPQTPLTPLEVEALEKTVLPDFIRAVPIYGHNVQYDCHWIEAKWGVFPVVDFDTMLAHQVLTSGLEPASLYALATKYCGMGGYEAKKRAAEQLLPKDVQDYFRMFDLREVLLDYGCGDTDAVARLRPIYEQQLTENGLWSAMHLITAAIPLVSSLQREGFALDLGMLDDLEKHYLEREGAEPRRVLEADPFYQLHVNRTGKPLNLESVPQLRELLYGTLQCMPDMMTAKNLPAVSRLAIEMLHDRYTQYRPLFEAISAVRKATYNYKNSIVKLRKKGHVFPDGRVRPEYTLDGTDTGRLSARDPPIHGVPRGSSIRKMYRSRAADGLILQLDYAQAELRVFAMLSGDREFAAVFERGEDPHKFCASQVLRVPPDEVTKEQRNLAKTVLFGLLYGRGASAISKVTELNEAQAKAFIQSVFTRFPVIAAWIDARKREGVVNERIWTPFGRRRLLPHTKYDQAEIERRAVNTVIQSSASDLTLIAALSVRHQLDMLKLESKLISFVHDALIFDIIKPDELWSVAKMAQHVMLATPMQFPWSSTVPMGVDPEVGPSWGEKCSLTLKNDGGMTIKGERDVLPRLKWSLRDQITGVELVPANPEKKKAESFIMTAMFAV